jgi:hypothetical protein
LQPENKRSLPPPKNSVLSEASQSIVCFAGLNNAQCQKWTYAGKHPRKKFKLKKLS